jgi:hypothetical protein
MTASESDVKDMTLAFLACFRSPVRQVSTKVGLVSTKVMAD